MVLVYVAAALRLNPSSFTPDSVGTDSCSFNEGRVPPTCVCNSFSISVGVVLWEALEAAEVDEMDNDPVVY